jgi:hypothetical protein
VHFEGVYKDTPENDPRRQNCGVGIFEVIVSINVCVRIRSIATRRISGIKVVNSGITAVATIDLNPSSAGAKLVRTIVLSAADKYFYEYDVILIMVITIIKRTDRAVIELNGAVAIVERSESRKSGSRDIARRSVSSGVDIYRFENTTVVSLICQKIYDVCEIPKKTVLSVA